MCFYWIYKKPKKILILYIGKDKLYVSRKEVPPTGFEIRDPKFDHYYTLWYDLLSTCMNEFDQVQNIYDEFEDEVLVGDAYDDTTLDQVVSLSRNLLHIIGDEQQGITE